MVVVIWYFGKTKRLPARLWHTSVMSIGMHIIVPFRTTKVQNKSGGQIVCP